MWMEAVFNHTDTKTQTNRNKPQARGNDCYKDKMFGGEKEDYCLLTAAGRYLTKTKLYTFGSFREVTRS